jgi:ATP phosphoribosyltransferase
MSTSSTPVPGRAAGPSATARPPATTLVRLGLPKGRMQERVTGLMEAAGLPVRVGARAYRPVVGDGSAFETKLLKARGVVEMLAAGTRDVGFAGADWVRELGAEDRVVEVLDTGFDPVRIVAAALPGLDLDAPRARPLLVATEYAGLTERWIAARGLDARVVRTFGATEVYPPEDADLIVDNTATGSTLAANGLEIRDELMRSSTRMFAARGAMDDPGRRDAIEQLALVLRSVLEARARVMVECNVPGEQLEAVIAVLPCMHEPTVASLHGGAGYAVKAAIRREELFTVIPAVKARGGFDIVVSGPTQIVP